MSRSKTSKRHQKVYKMKGCSKKSRCTRKKHRGGSCSSNLATTSSNVNGADPLYPNSGPSPNGFNFLNPLNIQRGGSCNCGSIMSGGKKGHRNECRCSKCKKTRSSMYGGFYKAANNSSSLSNWADGSLGTSYDNTPIVAPLKGGSYLTPSLIGSPYVNPNNLPGANGIPGDANYYSVNNYNNDVSRQMVNLGANQPFLNLKGGKKYRTRKQRGGVFNNFLGQDLINFGRQLNYGASSTFNALNGTSGPVNPLPWKDQLVSNN
jgi:hypothetical protein